MRSVVVPALFVAALACVASDATAQESYLQVVRNSIASHQGPLFQRGYQLDREMMTGSLADNTQRDLFITLQGGVSYALLGGCDQDCDDFDLRIFDPAGNQLAQDVATDDWPLLEITAPINGNYRLQVIMPGCNTSPCYWGVQIYRR